MNNCYTSNYRELGGDVFNFAGIRSDEGAGIYNGQGCCVVERTVTHLVSIRRQYSGYSMLHRGVHTWTYHRYVSLRITL